MNMNEYVAPAIVIAELEMEGSFASSSVGIETGFERVVVSAEDKW